MNQDCSFLSEQLLFHNGIVGAITVVVVLVESKLTHQIHQCQCRIAGAFPPILIGKNPALGRLSNLRKFEERFICSLIIQCAYNKPFTIRFQDNWYLSITGWPGLLQLCSTKWVCWKNYISTATDWRATLMNFWVVKASSVSYTMLILALLRQKASNFDFALSEVVTAADNLIDGELGVGISNWTNMSKYPERASSIS